MKKFLTQYWGILFLIVQTLVAFSFYLKSGTAMHFSVFSGASKLVLEGLSPYQAEFIPGNHEQKFLYSPTFAILFAPFAMLPETLGRAAYLLFSLIVFAFGVWLFEVMFEETHQIQISQHRWFNLACVIFGSEFYGAVYYCKIEILQLGLGFLALALLTRGRAFIPFFILSFVGGIKFQTVPVLGLAFIVIWSLGGEKKFALLGTVLGFATESLIPLFFYDSATVWQWQMERFATMSAIISEFWLTHYQHIFKTIHRAGIEISLEQVRQLTLVLAILYAAGMYILVSFFRERYTPNEAKSLSFLASFALGFTFLLLFSPMSQSNAYCLILPLLFLVMVLDRQGQSGSNQVLLYGSLLLISLVYSDLAPVPLRTLAREWSFKPWGILALYALLAREACFPSANKTQKAWPLAWIGQ